MQSRTGGAPRKLWGDRDEPPAKFSLALPSRLAARIDKMAIENRISLSAMIRELLEAGIKSRKENS